jgi:curli biogenesis system outer membrane secretion channel CsgG
MSILDFDYQTVIKQGNYNTASLTAIASAIRGGDPNALAHEDNQNIGAGLASLVKAEIFKGESFRILERQKLNAALSEQELAAGNRADPRAAQVARMQKVQAARFILTGAITKFGSDDKSIGGGGLLRGALGALALSKKKTIVEITAQVLDASTGEVLLSVVGHGISRKGGGLIVGGATAGGGAVGGSANTNVKESAIGEAMQLAAQDLAAKVVNARDVLLEVAAESGPETIQAPSDQDSAVTPGTQTTPEERLRKVEELFRKRLITKIEYDKKRAEILKEM